MLPPPHPWRAALLQDTEEGFELPVHARPRPDLPVGPFTRLPDGRIAGRDGDRIRVSDDGGASWSEGTRFGGADYAPTPEGAIGGSRDGALVFAFTDRTRRSGPFWDAQALEPQPDATLPCCVARSPDGGASWEPVQTLHEEWTGAVRDMLCTSAGRLVMTSMKALRHPGRHGSLTYCSDDGGATWRPSNVIDYGGVGHHDGALEPTIVERADGTLSMLVRTNWGAFWHAVSRDGGEHWHTLGPTGIDASSAPGILLRLASGRIALVWNRAHPSSGPTRDWIRGGNWHWSATPAYNFREELSIAFADDPLDAWSEPRIVARMSGGRLSYPYLFEPEPGVLWLTTQANFNGLRVELREEWLV